MPILKDLEGISAMLRDEKKQNILLLHKFVFEEKRDRNNSKRLRKFQGYEYNESNRLYFKKGNKAEDDAISIPSSSGAKNDRETESSLSEIPRLALNFRNIEDSVRAFSGEDNLSVEVWAKEFEDMATIMF